MKTWNRSELKSGTNPNSKSKSPKKDCSKNTNEDNSKRLIPLKEFQKLLTEEKKKKIEEIRA